MPRPTKGQRQPGSGRAKGTTNHDTAKLRGMIVEALHNAGGVDYLVRQAEESPQAFLSLIGKVLPKEITGADGGPVSVAISTIERVIIKAKD